MNNHKERAIYIREMRIPDDKIHFFLRAVYAGKQNEAKSENGLTRIDNPISTTASLSRSLCLSTMTQRLLG